MAAKSSSSQGPSEQRVPAWKRLGLQLKPPSTESTPSSIVGNGIATDASPGGATGKRKHPGSGTGLTHAEAPVKPNIRPAVRSQKSVRFAEVDSAARWISDPAKGSKGQPKTKKTKKSKKPPRKQKAPDTLPDMAASLEYLRQWRTARSSWKFNKNYQTMLVKYVFNPGLVPAADMDAFYDYVQDLQGFSRTRLRDAAAQLRDGDTAAATTDDNAAYESAIMDLMRPGRGPLRASFREEEFRRSPIDAALVDRTVKRMRAEILLQQLSGQGDAGATGDAGDGRRASTSAEGADIKRAKLNDGRRLPRPRKLRVAGDEESSSDSEGGSVGEDEDDEEEEEEEEDEEDDEEDDEEEESGEDDNEGDDDGAESESSSSSSSADTGGVRLTQRMVRGRAVGREEPSSSSSSSSSSDEEENGQDANDGDGDEDDEDED